MDEEKFFDAIARNDLYYLLVYCFDKLTLKQKQIVIENGMNIENNVGFYLLCYAFEYLNKEQKRDAFENAVKNKKWVSLLCNCYYRLTMEQRKICIEKAIEINRADGLIYVSPYELTNKQREICINRSLELKRYFGFELLKDEEWSRILNKEQQERAFQSAFEYGRGKDLLDYYPQVLTQEQITFIKNNIPEEKKEEDFATEFVRVVAICLIALIVSICWKANIELVKLTTTPQIEINNK